MRNSTYQLAPLPMRHGPTRSSISAKYLYPIQEAATIRLPFFQCGAPLPSKSRVPFFDLVNEPPIRCPNVC